MKVKISTHSIVDIITNSSSEIFTIESEKTKEFLVDMINQFCTQNKVPFNKAPFTLHESDIELESQTLGIKWHIDYLESLGYSVTRKDPTKEKYCITISRDTQNLEDLKQFLIGTLNAEVEYD